MTKWYSEILACPDCGDILKQDEHFFKCVACSFATVDSDQIDLRPNQDRLMHLEMLRVFDAELALDQIELGRPVVTYKGPSGLRDGRELLSIMQQVLLEPGQVLDLGCGPKDQFEPIASLGHKYVGVDLQDSNADILADVHALPFRSASFDFVFSFAVLEHLHNPFLALQEIKRVLKPSSYYCGTVSQGEPFHNSFFHHTAWGILSLANSLGMQVIRLWPCWDTLSGLADMGRYPKVVRLGIRALDAVHKNLPFLAPRKMKWTAKAKLIDELHRAASIGFIIRNERKGEKLGS